MKAQPQPPQALIANRDPRSDDLTLVRQIVAGDRGPSERLMRRHNRRLFRIARAALGNEADAEDALQEAYLSVYRSIAQFRGEASMSTWLSRMVLNECYARLRKSLRRLNIVPIVASDDMYSIETDGHDSPDRAVGRSEMRALIERKLDALPEDLRIAFVLRTVEELSVEETAAALGVAEATVRTRHFRARSLLRKSLARAIDIAERDLYEFGGTRCDRMVA